MLGATVTRLTGISEPLGLNLPDIVDSIPEHGEAIEPNAEPDGGVAARI